MDFYLQNVISWNLVEVGLDSWENDCTDKSLVLISRSKIVQHQLNSNVHQGWHFTWVKLVLPSPVGLTRFKLDKTGLKWAILGKIYTTWLQVLAIPVVH